MGTQISFSSSDRATACNAVSYIDEATCPPQPKLTICGRFSQTEGPKVIRSNRFCRLRKAGGRSCIFEFRNMGRSPKGPIALMSLN